MNQYYSLCYWTKNFFLNLKQLLESCFFISLIYQWLKQADIPALYLFTFSGRSLQNWTGVCDFGGRGGSAHIVQRVRFSRAHKQYCFNNWVGKNIAVTLKHFVFWKFEKTIKLEKKKSKLHIHAKHWNGRMSPKLPEIGPHVWILVTFGIGKLILELPDT